MSEPSPAFRFYPKDFMLGTATMSLAERGAYLLLLIYQWDHGSVPDDAAERARILSCSVAQADKLWRVVGRKFQTDGNGGWQNARLERERTKQNTRREALSASGRKGADARWGGHD